MKLGGIRGNALVTAFSCRCKMTLTAKEMRESRNKERTKTGLAGRGRRAKQYSTGRSAASKTSSATDRIISVCSWNRGIGTGAETDTSLAHAARCAHADGYAVWLRLY